MWAVVMISDLHQSLVNGMDSVCFYEDDDAPAGVDESVGVELLHEDEVKIMEESLGVQGDEDVAETVVAFEEA